MILTATSGDTGKAALEGFHDVPGTDITVFFPYGGVSPMQEAQMVTQEGANVRVCAVRGNFDDCQTGVKEAFAAEMSGLSLRNAGIRISGKKGLYYEDFGELMFTHFGVSGPVILSASSVVGKYFDEEAELTLNLPFAGPGTKWLLTDRDTGEERTLDGETARAGFTLTFGSPRTAKLFSVKAVGPNAG